jgi:single-stranded-DNA-specific exonuclease
MSVRFVQRSFDPAAARRLEAAGMPPALARALSARGVASGDELVLATRGLLPPGLLLNAVPAATLVADAIDAGQRLLIVADYDCDGATACAVGVRGLRALGAKVDYLVPNRFEYGYGLTPEIVDLAAQRKPDLLITVDNGIASVDGVARARELGIDVLITDHHLPGAQLPAARLIVNPNQVGCDFPSKHLAGVGVMFYLLTTVRAELRERGRFDQATQPRLDRLLDLVALGTVADVVVLDRNNRILVAAGLERIRRGQMQPGLAALLSIGGRSAATIQAADLGFVVGPRINAAGRLSDMTLGIECLVTDDAARAYEIAQRLDALNRERRALEDEMQIDALDDLASLGPAAVETCRTVTLFNEGWHQGVVGLIASRIKERVHRPTIAFARSDERWLRGSGRSIDGVHLRDTLDRVTKLAPDMIERFGGHAMAAGLTLRADRLDAFRIAFEEAARASTDPALFTRVIATDGELDRRDLVPSLVAAIGAHVWGQGFAAPLFDNEVQVLDQRLLKDQHLKLSVEVGGMRLPAIWFRRTETLPSRVRLAYRPTIDEFQGQARLTLRIEYASS